MVTVDPNAILHPSRTARQYSCYNLFEPFKNGAATGFAPVDTPADYWEIPQCLGQHQVIGEDILLHGPLTLCEVCSPRGQGYFTGATVAISPRFRCEWSPNVLPNVDKSDPDPLRFNTDRRLSKITCRKAVHLVSAPRCGIGVYEAGRRGSSPVVGIPTAFLPEPKATGRQEDRSPHSRP